MSSDSNGEKTVGAKRADNQRKILHAAEREFEEFGFGGARMQRIADRANLPKSNVLYYFGNKLELYNAVLADIIVMWNSAFDDIHEDDDPAIAIAAYIRAKLEYSRRNGRAARIFASEIVHGAPNLKGHLLNDSRQWVRNRASVIQRWIDQGKISAVDPVHLIMLIWGATQHYADYQAQITAINDGVALSPKDYDAISESLTRIILAGCGLTAPREKSTESI